MKLLLDEQIPRQVARLFPSSIDVTTVQRAGWGGITNGELLSLAAASGFDALVTADRNMQYQQNADALAISVVVFSVVRLRVEEFRPLVPKAIELLAAAEEPAFIRVNR